MQTTVSPIQLSTTGGSLLKRLSLTTFRAVRAVTAQAREVPGALLLASHDVRDAWRESARPKA